MYFPRLEGKTYAEHATATFLGTSTISAMPKEGTLAWTGEALGRRRRQGREALLCK